VLSENHAVLREGAQLLLDKETLSGDEIPRSTGDALTKVWGRHRTFFKPARPGADNSFQTAEAAVYRNVLF